MRILVEDLDFCFLNMPKWPMGCSSRYGTISEHTQKAEVLQVIGLPISLN